jgi:hypothetical protein
MTFEEMYAKISAIEAEQKKVLELLEKMQPKKTDLGSEIITGPEIRKRMKLSETQFRRVQNRMPFLFRYNKGGTVRAFLKDFDQWFKTQYRPEI